MRMIIYDRTGRERLVAIGDIAPTLACFLAGVLFGALAMLLAG